MREVLKPGVRESEMLATLMYENARLGGEYPETRLLTSGPRTNPWLQETSDRALEPGDLVAFDTDLIGPFGFFTDVSRTWLVGEGRIDERVIVDNALYVGDEKELLDCGIVGSERDGGYAEYVTVPAQNAHAVHSELSDAELATFPTSYTTSLRMLNRVRIAEGETILVTGASGGVGTGLVQLAKLRGAYVIAQVGSGKEEQARGIGADAVVRRDATDLAAEVKEAANGRSVDVVADVVGGPAFAKLLNVLRPMGRYVAAGAIAGPVVSLDLRTLYLKQLVLIGSTMGTHEEFAELVNYISSGELEPLLAKTYPLSQVRQAHEDFKAKSFFGKLALIPTEHFRGRRS